MSALLKTASLLSALALAGTAMATPVFVGHIDFQDSYGTTGGGEFYAHMQGDSTINPLSTGTNFQFGQLAGPGVFETFCMEKFEHLDIPMPTNGEQYKADLNTQTVASDANYAGGAHGGYNDDLDARTAYLYAHFITHSLASGYDYVNPVNRQNDADAMQTAMWFIEQEDTTPLTGKALAFWTEANNAVVSGAWVGLGSVRVLNIYTNSIRVEYQDVLVMTSIIPLPTGAGMAGLGLGGLAMIRRRRSR